MINISFQYTAANLQAAYELHLKKFSVFGGRIMLVLGFMILWAGLLLMLIYHKQGIQPPHIIFALLGIMVILFHFIYYNGIGKRQYARLQEYHNPFEIEMNEEVVALYITEPTSVYSWQQFSKAVVTEKMILLYFDDRLFYFFPVENFRDDSFIRFTELVKSKIAVVK